MAEEEGRKRGPPKPAEVIAFYKSKGYAHEQACEKAVESLQHALAFTVKRSQIQPERIQILEAHVVNLGKSVGDLSSKLSRLEDKLDAKPGLGGVFAAGFTAGCVVRGVFDVVPHVLRAVVQVSGNLKDSIQSSTV